MANQPIDAAGLREKMLDSGYMEINTVTAPHGPAQYRVAGPDIVFWGDTPSEAWALAVQHFTAPSYSSLAAEVIRLRQSAEAMAKTLGEIGRGPEPVENRAPWSRWAEDAARNALTAYRQEQG
jgi:hypothetical protein